MSITSGKTGEIGFIEDFSLAQDRTIPLAQLIPGTEDYYYYHALHYLNTSQFEKLDDLLPLWIDRYDRTGQVEEIENRRALLTYKDNPDKTLDHIRYTCGIHFNHQKETPGGKKHLPTGLDIDETAYEQFIKDAFSRHNGTTNGFEACALPDLLKKNPDSGVLRHLLTRLEYPDIEHLADHVVIELNTINSSGFGSVNIHNNLTLDQLDRCLMLKPELRNETQFIHVYLKRLHPNQDADWKNDAKETSDYLDRLRLFVSGLDKVHNSLKVHVAYHQLKHDRDSGIYDRKRFREYIRLPRRTGYINHDYIEKEKHRHHCADLNAVFFEQTGFPSIVNDEPLVRDFLQHFFVEDREYNAWLSYISDIYLKALFAETMIINGLGDMEELYSMLSPSAYQELKDRVDLDFLPSGKSRFGMDENVVLDLRVKNIDTLIIKIFEINTENYYREHEQEIGTDINLDGLMANEERTEACSENPLISKVRQFSFPEINKPGVFVIEFIGNGKSSRAVIRKGTLRFHERIGVAGHVFTIVDENNMKVNDASIFVAGHDYTSGEKGTITIPFTASPGEQPIIIRHKGFTCLDRFYHQTENYDFKAAMYTDREALVRHNKASVIVRPSLAIHGVPVTLNVLEDPVLEITTIDLDNVSGRTEIRDFALYEDRESVHEFQIPDRLRSVTFTLKARVKNICLNEDTELSDSTTFSLNEIGLTETIEDLYLSHINDIYTLDLLGKGGEAMPDQPMTAVLKFRDLTDEVRVSLQTDSKGRIHLGRLKGVEHLRVEGLRGRESVWHFTQDRCTYPSAIHTALGETVILPYMGAGEMPARSEFALLEYRGTVFYKDLFDLITINNGFIRLENLPAGDYKFMIKTMHQSVNIRVAGKINDIPPVTDHGYIMNAGRHLEATDPEPLQIVSADSDRKSITIQLAHATAATRVHVFATTWVPEYSLFDNLNRIFYPGRKVLRLSNKKSRYVSGRDIGDEYRYILDRKYAHQYPGNLLKKPELLLNPWAVRSTDTDEEQIQDGEAWADVPQDEADAYAAVENAYEESPHSYDHGFSTMDFLKNSTIAFLNLEPDEKNQVKIDRADIENKTQLHIIALDHHHTVLRKHCVADPESEFPETRDMTLFPGLDPTAHFTENNRTSIVQDKGVFHLKDITTSKFAVYDTLEKVARLYLTLSEDDTLKESLFATRWVDLDAEERKDKYSAYACHELNFFLYKKDPQFFRQVILPHIENKKDKTFLDKWLIHAGNGATSSDEMAEYLKPWKYSQLNIVEKILLSHCMPDETESTSRFIKERVDMVPPDIDHDAHLFNTALKGSELDAEDGYGYAEEAELSMSAPPPPAAMAGARRSRAKKSKAMAASAFKEEDPSYGLDEAPAEMEAEMAAPASDGVGGEMDDLMMREQTRQYYRKLDMTREFAENNYYHLGIDEQNADLVTENAFWRDFASHTSSEPFFSTHLTKAAGSFTEMIFALSVLDLPFKEEKHDVTCLNAEMTLNSRSPMVVFHREIMASEKDDRSTPVLVNQNFFRHNDRYYYEDNQQMDKYVTDEFLVHVIYGCQVVITNPTSSRQKLDILVEIPRGAIPVLNSHYTRTVNMDLHGYSTQTIEYYFYFPKPGSYAHFPVHVSKKDALVAFEKPFVFNVVTVLSKMDTTTWDYVSQHGSGEDVLDFLDKHNINRVNLERIAWRLKERDYYDQVISLLTRRHVYHHTLWSYAIFHNDIPNIREYLQFHDGFTQTIGLYINSDLVTLDPVVRKAYQHLEYSPLVNPRTHPVGKRPCILNEQFNAQYHRLMKVLSYKNTLGNDDLMAVTCYMLLQDRISDADQFFSRVNPDLPETRIQYDYFDLYLSYYKQDFQRCMTIAEKYAGYPVDRWRKIFQAALQQIREIDATETSGMPGKPVDDKDRNELQKRLADTEPALEFAIEAGKLTIMSRNISDARVNYYPMDIELLFSRNPFVQEVLGNFSSIKPNTSDLIQISLDQTETQFDLPEHYRNTNLMVEIEAAGIKKSHAYYANHLNVHVIENYGQLMVTQKETGHSLSTVYVKVYAGFADGRVKFYKDGYTDPAGRFDYTSLNTDELDHVEKFSILILSEKHGAVVREAKPPKQ